MGETTGFSGGYRVEVSGWGLNDVFFVEKTDLVWTRGEEKKLLLRHVLQNGAIIFVRLANPGVSRNSVPVAYRVENVQPINDAGQCEMSLLQLHPRSKESSTSQTASEEVAEEDSNRTCESTNRRLETSRT